MIWNFLALTRFILAFIVACSHLKSFVDDRHPLLWFYNLGPMTAVFGFLMISGYSIAASLDKQPKGFYYRRVLRLIPLYYLAIVFTYLSKTYIGGAWANYSFKEVFLSSLGLQGLVIPGISLYNNPVLWTLGVEIFMYAIAPLLIKKSDHFLLSLISLSIVGYALYPFSGLTANGTHYGNLGCGLAIVFLSWFWILGFWFYRNQDKKPVFLLIATIGFTTNDFMREPLSWLTFLSVCLVLCYGDRLRLSDKDNRYCLAAGDWSYPLYLFHYPLFLILIKAQLSFPYLMVGSAVALSAALNRFYDRPIKQFINSLKRRHIF